MSVVGYEADEFPGVKKVYQKSVTGRFRTIKSVILIAMMIGFYGLAWIPWDRPGPTADQAFLMSFTEGKFYAMWFTFWPQDLYLLTLVLLFSAFGLFFTNTIVGRVWCGFSCPQTLWTDWFQIVERFFEGDRNERLRRDEREGLTPGNLARKVGKHGTWAIIGLLTGMTLIGYFNGTWNTFSGVATLSASTVTLVLVGVFAGLTVLLAGFAREKVCLYFCPWPRFQSAMLDTDTKIVTYHAWRGEPRGKPKKKAGGEALGDCVDCNLCVNVCPTGVDIRNGLQLGCIGCGLCADACDGIMTKLKRPTGLINFASLAETHEEAHLAAPVAEVGGRKGRLPKVRMYGYGTLLILVAAAMVFTVLNRTGFDVAITPERQPAFVTLSDGSIRNIYNVRLSDRGAEASAVRFEIEGLDTKTITVSHAGSELAQGPAPTIAFDNMEAAALRVLVTVPPTHRQEGRTPITFSLINADDGRVMTTSSTYFWGPETN